MGGSEKIRTYWARFNFM